RTAKNGGGAPPLPKIARMLFGAKDFSSLSEDDKDTVFAKEEKLYRWKNLPNPKRVESATCQESVMVPEARNDEKFVCSDCLRLLKDKVFKNALARPMPDEENLKFTPH
ncbi:hypothetical protein BV25DRAFT_1770662, partial [Artomyces pyxidatus]